MRPRLAGRAIRFSWRHFRGAVYRLFISLPYFRFIRDTRDAQTPITVGIWFWQKVLGFNRKAYWPMHFTSRVAAPENVLVGVDTSAGYEGGCYIQAIAPVTIGDYTAIARNVGIISANHDPNDLRRHVPQPVSIGSYCWIGMNAVILPGVTLGDFTIVGAGAVVTRSFPEGCCVIAGNPASVIRTLASEQCLRYRNDREYVGYIPAAEFPAYRRARLRV
jgi:acetyltransferase-like isoleucine patch superfamily enzyme